MTTPQTMTTQNEVDDDEIDLMDLAIALGEEKKVFFGVPAVTTTLAIVVSLLMSPVFTAKTVVIPPQQGSGGGAAAALAGLGALAGLAGGAAGIKTPDEMYMAYMKSDSLADAVIKKLDLKTRYDNDTFQETRKDLESLVKIQSDKKSGLITLEADDKDPAFAALLANTYVEEFKNLLDRLAVTEAQQRRLFFEQQVKKTDQALKDAERAFAVAREKSGLQVTALVAETGLQASAQMRAQIAVKEVQIQAMSSFATSQNPDVQRAASELAALRQQLAKFEQGTGKSSESAQHRDAFDAYRDVKVQTALLEVMIKQYELARVDEAKEGPLVQQIDKATAPEKKSKPKRALIVILSMLAGGFIGLLAALVRRALRQASATRSEQVATLKKAWRWRH